MPKTLIPAAASAIQINPIIITFKPRQVLLASSSKSIMTAAAMSPTLSEENKSLLRHSIAQYLQKSGLSKTLKKFRSEAQLEEDGSKGLNLDLEEMCFRYLEKVNPLVTKGSEVKLEVKEPSNNVESEDAVDKKRKKDKKKESKSVTTDKENQPSEPLPQAEKESKDTKKKKKSKSSTDASVSEDTTKAAIIDQPSEPLPQLETKSKDKKKKKSKSSADASVNEDETKATEASKENGVPKKRKREESPEEDVHTEKKSLDESKRRKKGDGSKEDKSTKASKSNENQADECAGQEDQVDLGEAEKTPSKPVSSNENGTLEKSGGKFSESKSSKKQRNGSAEPQSTTVKAFQRIKVEEVEFAHDKLKDNSYWAKDGADTGYGAKAQEVLGQVRGRDFRHEKTKKKRGSYRGGQIDLDSHSFKFNYSDEE